MGSEEVDGNRSKNVMEDEEDEETIAPLCTCGQYQDDMHAKPAKSSVTSRKTPNWLEYSFVHLMAPRRHGPTTANKPSHHHAQHGFLEQHQHVLELMEAATTSHEVSICNDCIDRVAAALEADTQRLYEETEVYQETIVDAKQRARQAVSNMDLAETEQAYRNELAILAQEVEAREQELVHLSSLYKEQQSITQELEVFGSQVEEEQNALELHSKSFDDSAKLLTRTLAKVQNEVDQLSLVRLPLSLFDLQVDERGLRYPLINHLRLAFRPKGDVTDKEIRVAWSLATQLLLTLGTLLQFSSSEWKLVPLADCAKIIYRKEIFNLGPGDCRSFTAWHALMDQMVRHTKTFASAQTTSTGKPFKPPPFPSSPTTIGNTDIARLDKNDQLAWSQVIHRMACNLLWLTERVSELAALQVSTAAHSVT